MKGPVVQARGVIKEIPYGQAYIQLLQSLFFWEYDVQKSLCGFVMLGENAPVKRNFGQKSSGRFRIGSGFGQITPHKGDNLTFIGATHLVPMGLEVIGVRMS